MYMAQDLYYKSPLPGSMLRKFSLYPILSITMPEENKSSGKSHSSNSVLSPEVTHVTSAHNSLARTNHRAYPVPGASELPFPFFCCCLRASWTYLANSIKDKGSA